MDRRWSLAARTLGAGLALGLAAAAPVSAPPLREMRWVASTVPRADALRVLTSHPVECLAPASDPATAAAIAVGRAMFSAPLLLGGQAARAGISCAVCHVAGRGNPQFAFPGVSGPPGTADVTSSLFSSRRGDGVFNPRPIPDLAVDLPRINRDPADPLLRRFIHGLIVEEFDGLEPPPRILDGLAAYVRALRGNCGGTIGRSGTGDAEDAIAVVSAARAALAQGDSASARLLVGAARSMLGRIDERFANMPDLARRLARHDAELRRLQALAVQDPVAMQRGLARWAAGFARDGGALRAAEPASLYVAAVLDRQWTETRIAALPGQIVP